MSGEELPLKFQRTRIIMPKVLVLTSELKTNGGIQRYTRHVLRCLTELNGPRSVRAITLSSNSRQARPSLQQKLRLVLSSLVQAARFNPDLLICNHVGLAPVASLLRRLFGVKYLLLTYGDEVWRDLPSRFFHEAEAVITISRFTEEILRRKHGVAGPRIKRLPVAIEPQLLQERAATAEVIERHGLRGKRVLLTVGRLESRQYKGHDVVIRSLVRARQHVPNLVYLIVGDGEHRGKLQTLARSLGLEQVVLFAGAVEDRLLAAYYQASDVFIMPSLTEVGRRSVGEGFGIVYLEAAAFGKPAIAGRGGGVTDAVEDGLTGLLVDPANVDEVTAAIIRLFADDHLRHRLGQQARARALAEFTLDRFRQNLRSICLAHGIRG